MPVNVKPLLAGKLAKIAVLVVCAVLGATWFAYLGPTTTVTSIAALAVLALLIRLGLVPLQRGVTPSFPIGKRLSYFAKGAACAAAAVGWVWIMVQMIGPQMISDTTAWEAMVWIPSMIFALASSYFLFKGLFR